MDYWGLAGNSCCFVVAARSRRTLQHLKDVQVHPLMNFCLFLGRPLEEVRVFTPPAKFGQFWTEPLNPKPQNLTCGVEARNNTTAGQSASLFAPPSSRQFPLAVPLRLHPHGFDIVEGHGVKPDIFKDAHSANLRVEAQTTKNTVTVCLASTPEGFFDAVLLELTAY